MARIGYARVSTHDQNPEAQAARLRDAGCEKIFTDEGVSGKLASRPEWDACMAYLREGDTLVAVKLDRIGRSVVNLASVITELAERGVDLEIPDQAIDTSTASGKLIFHVLAAIAEYERGLIYERTMDGLAAARAAGKKPGRKFTMDDEQVALARQLLAEGDHGECCDGPKAEGCKAGVRMTKGQVADRFGVHRSTLYDYINPDGRRKKARPQAAAA